MATKTKPSADGKWTTVAYAMLIGLRVKNVRYMTEGEALAMGWTKRPAVIEFDNGLQVYASADDEGNDGGALFTTDEVRPVLPVLR